jgi:hypothetical protein
MTDTGPEERPVPPSWRVPGLLARLRRGPGPEDDLDDDDARTIGLIGIDRHRRPR